MTAKNGKCMVGTYALGCSVKPLRKVVFATISALKVELGVTRLVKMLMIEALESKRS